MSTTSAVRPDSTETTNDPQYAGHPMVAIAELGPDLVGTLEAALAHRTPLNRHLTAMLRAASGPELAHALFHALSRATAAALTGMQPADSWTCPYCVVESYAKQGLLEHDDQVALTAAQSRVAVVACGFGVPPTEDELFLLHHDPQALVRAAYALARDYMD